LLAAVASVQTEFEALSWQAFWMTTVEGRGASDVAFDLGLTRNAVYLAKSRILKRLRIALSPENTDEGSRG
jgi:RNA polymerase sigma-70 factor (ECF subfamily)